MQTHKNTFAFILLTFFFFNLNAQITYEAAFPNLDFEFPVEIQSPEDGTNRMFVVEQRGRIKVFNRSEDVMTSNTFLDIVGNVNFSSGQEKGLLGLAFHPNYQTNGYFYVYYTTESPVSGVSTRMVLSRFSVDSNNNNLADNSSELIIFQFDKNQIHSNHNGGKIAFGPDGYLYISFGDGGGGNDPQGNSQNKETVFGSICRIDVDLDGNNPVETNPILPNGNYEIPSDNPLVGATGLDEIYAYGIRNTWKFSFDNPTGRLWGADVGQNAFEEINLIENGENYGWSRFEANSIANSGVTINEPTTFPVFSYNRSQGDVSITGGYVYRGTEITSLTPDINSKYIYGDYISGRVWALDYNASTGDASSTLLFKTNGEFVSSFGVDNDGELYFSDYGTNAQLYKLVDGETPASGTPVNGSGEWQFLAPEGVNGQVFSVATGTNGDIYHGGDFNQAGAVSANNIAVWNETNGWSALSSGSNGIINSIKIASNGNVYAGGSFTEIGGVTANNIAVWNGSMWSALESGVNGPILCMEIDSAGNLYAAGVFETVNSTTTRNIAMWNGSQWSALTDSTNSISGTNNEIRVLAVDDNDILYVGGNFDEAGGVTANRIATWDGSNWGTLGSGTSGFVQAIATTSTDVYLGGNFAIAGGVTVNRIASWNKASSNWSKLGNGLNNNVNDLIHDGTYLYAAGVFDIAFDVASNKIVDNIARWSDTNGWEAMGTNTQVGVDIKINDIEFSSDEDGIDKISAGGSFSRAGSINTNNTALWLSDNLLSTEDIEVCDEIKFYPNPTSSFLYMSQPCNWTISNSLGQVLLDGIGSSIDFSQFVSGMYFINIKDKEVIKIIKQ